MKRSEEKYRRLFESMNEGFCLYEILRDSDGAPFDAFIHQANPAYKRLTERPDPVGRTLRSLDPSLEQEWLDTLSAVEQRGEPARFTRYSPVTGRWFDVRAAVQSEDGKRLVSLIFTDVTEQILTERSLRESEKRFRALVTATSQVTYRMNADWSEMHQLDGHGLLTDTATPRTGWINEYILPEDHDAVRAAIAAAVQSRETFEFEHRVRRRDGSIGWVHSRAVPLLDSEGHIAEWFGAASDITDRRQAEEAVRQGNERYRSILLEATDYAIFTTDADRLIESWPEGAQAVFGWTADEAIGMLFDETFTADDRAAGIPVQVFNEARDTGSSPNTRWRARKDGNRVFIEGTVSARHAADGTFLGVFKIGQDITERYLTSEALRASEENLQQKVVAATAELRTLSRRLLEVQEDERRALALELHDEIGQALTGLSFQIAGPRMPSQERINNARQMLRELTEQVQRLSMQLRPAILDHFGLTEALRWYLDHFETNHGIAVTFEVDKPVERSSPNVEINAFRIVQEALTNVSRHANVTEAMVRINRDDQALRIEISDHGNGFDPDRFRTSTGLGGMRERVELLGGTITFRSAPGEGTVVTVLIPQDGWMSGGTDQPA